MTQPLLNELWGKNSGPHPRKESPVCTILTCHSTVECANDLEFLAHSKIPLYFFRLLLVLVSAPTLNSTVLKNATVTVTLL